MSDTIVVWFSCGAASAVAAKLTIAKYSPIYNIRVVNTPIKEEDPDNRRFLIDCEEWLGVNIEEAISSKYPNSSAYEVWEDKKAMSFINGAPCTAELKKKARYEWESANDFKYLVMGFTLEEKTRADRFKLFERDNLIPILIEEGISKDECFHIVQKAGLRLPRVYSLGYPNANCIGCVKATSPTYWNLVREKHPTVFQSRLEQSERLKVKLVRYKGKRVYLSQLPQDARGRKLKSMPECGIFCEEKA